MADAEVALLGADATRLGGFVPRLRVNGPMTPTKEPLGGFYIIEAASMEEAVEWAKQGRFRPGPNEVRELREG
jgi:hypothetical protein